jgi:hypothetical protein
MLALNANGERSPIVRNRTRGAPTCGEWEVSETMRVTDLSLAYLPFLTLMTEIEL